jgi:DNA-binding MarR family transcriptional regulator
MSIPRKISRVISRSLYEAYKTYNKQLSSFFVKESYSEITANSYQYLYMIYILNKYENLATITGISDRMGVKKAATAQMVDNLIRTGYVIKKDNPNDKRSSMLELSEKGSKMLRLEEVFSNDFLEYFCDELTPDEMQILENIAIKISNKLKAKKD